MVAVLDKLLFFGKRGHEGAPTMEIPFHIINEQQAIEFLQSVENRLEGVEANLSSEGAQLIELARNLEQGSDEKTRVMRTEVALHGIAREAKSIRNLVDVVKRFLEVQFK